MGLFFNVRGPRKYEHRPIYYDPRKEAMEEREERIKKEMGMVDEKEYKPHIQGAFIEQTQHLRRRRANPEKSSTSHTIKLAVLLVVLLILFYWFYIR